MACFRHNRQTQVSNTVQLSITTKRIIIFPSVGRLQSIAESASELDSRVLWPLPLSFCCFWRHSAVLELEFPRTFWLEETIFSYIYRWHSAEPRIACFSLGQSPGFSQGNVRFVIICFFLPIPARCYTHTCSFPILRWQTSLTCSKNN